MICSQAFVKKSGSSFGTLIAFSFINISKNLKGKTECNHEDIISIFEVALKTIQERGKTKLGDKTIADSLDLIIKKLKDNKNYPEAFKSATKQALEDFKGKKILVGRARMFEDKTKDLDDPGMFALNRLTSVFQLMETLILLALVIVIGWILFRPFSKKELDRFNDKNWPDMNL